MLSPAAIMSLSPIRSSAVASASFSLMIGTTPQATSCSTVCLRFANREATRRSSSEMRICATVVSYRSKLSVYARISRDCPIVDSACCVWRSSAGTCIRPMPAPTAPDETTITALPVSRRSCTSSTSLSIRSVSRCELSSVNEFVPALTTTSSAAAAVARARSIATASAVSGIIDFRS